MEKDTGVYLVNSPTIYLPPSGLSVCIISNNEAWQVQVVEMFEKIISQTQLTFFLNTTDYVDPKSWQWIWTVSKNCDLILVDGKHSTELERQVALCMAKDDQPVIFFIPDGLHVELKSILHQVSIPACSHPEQLEAVIGGILGE